MHEIEVFHTARQLMKSIWLSVLILTVLCAPQGVTAQEELKEVTVPKRAGALQFGGKNIAALLKDKEIPILGGIWGGEIMVDSPLNSEPAGAHLTVRRAKLRYARGFGDNWQAKLTANYTKGGGLELDDNYLVYSGWKTALLMFGLMDPPFSLESSSSSSAITFMERSLATDALSERQSGGLTFLKRTPNQILNGMLVFLNPKEDDLRQSGQAVILHYVYSPIDVAGKDNIHVGGSFSYRQNTQESSTQFRSRPEVATVDDYFVDTGTISGADKVLRASFEASRVSGRFSWQTEVLTTKVQRQNMDKVSFWGAYLYASWFLTDDSRNYDPGTGKFVDVKPQAPMFNGGWRGGWGDGWGAFELAGRFSYVDLTSADIKGGRQSNVSLGLNWYLNQNVRLMTDLVKVLKVNRPGSEFDNQDPLILSIRAQWLLR